MLEKALSNFLAQPSFVGNSYNPFAILAKDPCVYVPVDVMESYDGTLNKNTTSSNSLGTSISKANW